MQTKISIVFSDQLNIKLIGGTSFLCIIFRANFSFLPVFVVLFVIVRHTLDIERPKSLSIEV